MNLLLFKRKPFGFLKSLSLLVLFLFTAIGLKAGNSPNFLTVENLNTKIETTTTSDISTCVDPTELYVYPYNTYATLTWYTPIAGAPVEIVWGAVGFSPDTGTPVYRQSANAYIIQGLTELTSYDVYIRQICGEEQSAWVKYTFTTIQICPSSSVTLRTQQEVNNFWTSFPACTEIAGNLTIDGATITDLTALGNIESIWYLNIYNTSLTNLNGLGSLEEVKGSIGIGWNDELINLEGLNSLEQIGYGLEIWDNDKLANLNGLESLKRIENNYNSGTELRVVANPMITDISAISNVDPTSINRFDLFSNTNLAVCSNEFVCTYLELDPNMHMRAIYGNATGCEGANKIALTCIPCVAPTEITSSNIVSDKATMSWISDGDLFDVEWGAVGFSIGNGTRVNDVSGASYTVTNLSANTSYDFYVRKDCEVNQSEWLKITFTTISVCPPEFNPFTTQAEVDAFGATYPNCTNFAGTLVITGDNITNLSPLSNIQTVENGLTISGTTLSNLNDLSAITNIVGAIHIENNAQLSDISILNDLIASEITELKIINNPNLSTCNLSSFCTYLQGTGEREIHSNGTDCESDEAIIANCASLCVGLTNLTASNIQEFQANLNWTSDGVSFDLEWGTEGFSRGSGTTINNITELNYTITDLDANTSYDVYVRQNCIDDLGEWVKITFSTLLACPTGDLQFSNQNDVDGFGLNYAHCKNIQGDLKINGGYNFGIDDLTGLSNIETVDGILEIYYTNISDLNGLSSITSINGYIDIYSNEYLSDISGLQNISSGIDGIYIERNFELSNCNISNFCSYLQDSGDRWIDNNAQGCESEDAVISKCLTCANPMNLTSSLMIDDSAKLSWMSSNALFDIEIISSTSTPTGIPTYTSVSNGYTVGGLTPGAEYQYYVRGHCNVADLTEWVGPFTFTADSSAMYEYEIGTAIVMEEPAIDLEIVDECYGELEIQVPAGKKIKSVQVQYDIYFDSWHTPSEFRSIVYSPSLELGESAYATSSVEDDYRTSSYSRELLFLEGATGNIQLQLRTLAVREYTSSYCQFSSGVVEGSWVVNPVFVDEDECIFSASTVTSEVHSESSFTINWAQPITIDISYGPAGTLAGEGELLENLQGNSYTFDNVEEEEIHYYVRKKCSDEDVSGWEGPYIVKFDYCYVTVNEPYTISITDFYFSNIENETFDHYGYNDFTDQVADIVRGEYSPIEVGINISFPSTIYAYIDFNHNLNFEENELFVIRENANQSRSYYEDLFIPSDAKLGPTRMRVIATSYAGNNYSACGSLYYGEVEDYTVNITTNEIIWTTDNEWNNEVGPNETSNVIIEGDLTLSEGYLELKNITIAEGGSITIPAETTLVVHGNITTAGAESFVVGNNGNLIQLGDDTTNTGDITVVRHSSDMVRLDYAMWSSPVAGQNIQGFSPETLPNRIYTYENDQYVTVDTPSENEFEPGKGYMFRAPNNWWQDGAPLPAQPYIGTFIGQPRNGNISIPVHEYGFTSIGNPYPSNIYASSLFDENYYLDVLYFWKNGTPIYVDGEYTGNNFITYTNMGSTDESFNGTITVGQGFIAASEGSQVEFNNYMRTDQQGDFSKNGTLERNRFWLNFSEENKPAYNQILIGYMTGATNEQDLQIDGKLFGYDGPAIYSIIDEENYAVQGRALPFEMSDVVKLGFKANDNKNFTIAKTQADELFTNEVTVYLKDKELDWVHNLNESAYTFEATEGTHNERFEIIYQTEGEMGVQDLTDSSILVYQENKQIVVDAKAEKLVSVELFDLQGRQIYQNTKVNASMHKIDAASFGVQVFVVKAKTAEGKIVTKKVVNK